MKSFEAVVDEVVAESAEATTLFLAPREPVEYRAGQFVSVDPHQFGALGPLIADLEHRKAKKELVRAYSLSSSPHEARLAITVKVEAYDPKAAPYPPLLSPLLTHGLRRGDVLQLMGCSGLYNLPPDLESRGEQVLHLVAGSGIVPNLSLIRWDLETRSKLKHTLIASNKMAGDILFRRQLEDLQRRFPDRLQIINALTREPGGISKELARVASPLPLAGEGQGEGGPADPKTTLTPAPLPQAGEGMNVRFHTGRVSLDLLRAHVGDPATVECYCCGRAITMHERKKALAEGGTPVPRFLETMVGMLKELGVDRKRIHQESFG